MFFYLVKPRLSVTSLLFWVNNIHPVSDDHEFWVNDVENDDDEGDKPFRVILENLLQVEQSRRDFEDEEEDFIEEEGEEGGKERERQLDITRVSSCCQSQSNMLCLFLMLSLQKAQPNLSTQLLL